MADQAGEGRVPDCLGIDFKEKFMSPQGADIYKVGDIVPVSWYGGKSGQRDRPILVTLLLNSKDDATVNMTILRSASYTFGFDGEDDDPSQEWLAFDLCGNTKLTYNWTVPESLTITPQGKYHFQAQEVTGGQLQTMATSETFLIQRVEKSGTPSSPNDTANPMSSATNSSEDNKGPPSSSLPVGAKAAIGVSVPVALILLGIAASFFWRRKARRTSPRKEGPHPASQARYEKPELDARAEVGARVVGNTHLAEVDGREKASGPVELDGAHIEPGKAV